MSGMKLIHWMLLALTNAATVALFFLGPENPHPQAWDSIPIFYALCGFAGCLLIIFVAQVLGKALLKRPEDYYDRNR